MAGKTLTVYLAADLKKFSSGINEAERGLLGLGNNLTNMLGPALIGAGIAAGAFAAKLAVDGVQAALAEEESLGRLNQTLSNLGFEAQSDAINTFIDDLQYTSAVADTDLRTAFDRLVRSTGDVSEAQRALRIALDASAGTGKSLQTVADALGKAYDGNTGALGRLGVGIDSATLKSGDLEAITSKMADTFGGQASRQASTLKGRMDVLKIATDELIEAFGIGLVGAADNSAESLDKAAQAMRNAQPAAQRLGGFINQFAVGGLELTDALFSVKTAINQGRWDYLLKVLTSTKAELPGLTREMFSLGQQFEYVQYAAYGAANATSSLNNSISGLTDPVRMNAEHTFRLGEIVNTYGARVYDATENVDKHGSAVEKTNPLIERQTDIIQGTIGKLEAEVKALEAATRARDDYANAVSASIMGDISLKDVFDPTDVQGSIQRFSDAISGATGFSDALAKLGLSLPDSPGAEAFIQQVLGLGTVAGNQFLAGLTPEIANNLVSKLEASISSVSGNAYLLANHFYGEGIESAQQSVDGFIVQIGKEEKRLREIGKSIGKPIGANIKAEIAQAVAEAIRAAEAAKTAASAEKAAEVARQQVSVTQQAVTQTLNQMLNNSNNRTGYTTAQLYQMGVLH